MAVAASFVAADKSWLQIADGSQSGLDPGTSDFTIAFSLYLNNTSSNYNFIVKGTGADASSTYRIGTSGNKLYITFCDNAGAAVSTTFSTALTSTIWHDILVTFDRDGVITAYIDGVADATTRNISSMQGAMNNAANFAVGSWNGSGVVSGSLSHVRFWSRLLTAGEIARQANRMSGVVHGRPYALLSTSEKVGLVSSWELQEGPWSASQQALDSHGSNHLSFSAAAIINATTLNGGFETQTAGTEALSNTGFETLGGGGADVFGTWAETAGDGAIADEGSLVQAGSHAAKLTAGATANTVIAQTITVTGGQARRFSFYSRGDGTYGGQYAVYDVTNSAYIVAKTATGVTGTTYTQVTSDYQVPATCTSVRVELWCPTTNTGIAYYDTCSDKPLLPSTWTISQSGTSKVQTELTAPYAGTYSGRFDMDSSNSTCIVYQDGIATAGKQYTVTIYGKSNPTSKQIAVDVGNSAQTNITLTNSYATYANTITSGSGNTRFRVKNGTTAASAQLYFEVAYVAANILTAAGPQVVRGPVFGARAMGGADRRIGGLVAAGA